MTEEEFQNQLIKARTYLADLQPYLPSRISADEVGVWAKAPYKALMVRGGLLWRSFELGTDAIKAFSENHLATAIILTRAIIENAALHSRLADLIERFRETPADELSETLTRMLVGWKNEKAFPQALNVLTMIDSLNKIVPSVRYAYDQLSEIAHPNYSGVHGLYLENNESSNYTEFGPSVRSIVPRHSISILVATLGLHHVSEIRFAEAHKSWVQSLPSLDDPKPDDDKWWISPS